ncbi:hypothetical protein HPB49_018334 [Dermacentor silvarum]|uniref:Uncharacterized protein n=1 Tax=Dermacentor silvarum TaxID=543639 RepID=A0ACB8C4U8_DERSI|nr:hypothetical protein HPB49_018334 [Dermacentor silvarum]
MANLEDPAAAIERLAGTAVDIVWQEGKPPAPATLLAVDASKMVKRLKHMLEKAAATESVSVSSRNVDIGDGVLIEEGTLARLRKDSSNSACCFARGLIRAVFTPEELINKSLFGKKSNAHKENVPKEALDPRRVNAVLGFTLQNYKETSALNVKNTLSSMLARDYAPAAVEQPH